MKYDLPLKKWIIATFIGWFIGIVILLIISFAIDALGIKNLHFFIGIVMGLSVGFMQWQMLNNIIPINKKWIWYAMLGLTLPFLTLDLLPFFTQIVLPDYQLSIPIVLGAICVGALQLKLLKPFAKKADLWVFASILGWGGAGLCMLSIDYADRISSNVIFLSLIGIVLTLLGGLLLAYISGRFLKAMLINTPRNMRKIRKT